MRRREKERPEGREEWVPVPKHLKVGDEWDGLTVFDAVRRAFSELSAREVFRQARCGEIRRDGGTCHPLDPVTPGEVLTVTLRRPPPVTRAEVQRQDVEVETAAGGFLVVREDLDLLVVSKPAGCASHPAARHKGDTLIERVRQYLSVEPDDAFQPALANRLDIDTSGLVLVAKGRGAQRRLGRNLQKGLVKKWYVALVGGWPEPREGEIAAPLLRHPDSRDLQRFGPAHPRSQGRLQEARTRYHTVERMGQPLRCALLEVELLTGRTHQIRRHLTHLGHPLAGDRRYGDPHLNRDLRQVAGLDRMFLHAWRLELTHPGSGEPLELEAPLPVELQGVVRALGGRFPPAE